MREIAKRSAAKNECKCSDGDGEDANGKQLSHKIRSLGILGECFPRWECASILNAVLTSAILSEGISGMLEKKAHQTRMENLLSVNQRHCVKTSSR